jgi:hypothetical protein
LSAIEAWQATSKPDDALAAKVPPVALIYDMFTSLKGSRRMPNQPASAFSADFGVLHNQESVRFPAGAGYFVLESHVIGHWKCIKANDQMAQPDRIKRKFEPYPLDVGWDLSKRNFSNIGDHGC